MNFKIHMRNDDGTPACGTKTGVVVPFEQYRDQLLNRCYRCMAHYHAELRVRTAQEPAVPGTLGVL